MGEIVVRYLTVFVQYKFTNIVFKSFIPPVTAFLIGLILICKAQKILLTIRTEHLLLSK